jgi:endonuclease YncB( thermonuclease family)
MQMHCGKMPKRFDLTPYIQAEAEAKESQRGMWSLGNKYINPKEWRKMHRGR